MKENLKKNPKLKKLKIYFILVIIILWCVASFKLYLILREKEIVNEISFFKSNTNLELEDEEVFPEGVEEVSPESPDVIFFKGYINDLYSDYYEILNVRVINYIPEDEKFSDNDKFYFVTIEKKLKFSSVFQLPFVSGMQKAVDEINESSKNVLIKKAKSIYNKKTNELKKYIGEKQIEHNIFKISFAELNNFENTKIEIATYHDKISADLLAPPSFDELVNSGYNFIKSAIKIEQKNIDYDNYKAIGYADKYSSNPFKAGMNRKRWNDEYKPYENDCANFVSQCLYYGGVLKTSKWFPGSFYWIRTGSPKYSNISGVSNYMQKLNNFYRTNYSAVSAGGFICLIDESHVVFITSNDSITILCF